MQPIVVILKDDLPQLREVATAKFGKESKESIEILLWSELKHSRSPKALFEFVRRLRCRRLAIGFSDLDCISRPVLYKALLLYSGARERLLFDAGGRLSNVPFLRFILVDMPLLFWELIRSTAVVSGLYMVVGFMCQLKYSKKKMISRPLRDERKKVAYIRIHFFSAIFGGTLAHTRGAIEGFQQNRYQVVLFSSDHVHGLENFPKFHLVCPPAGYENVGEIREMAYNLSLIWRGFWALRRAQYDCIYYRHTGFCVAPLILAKVLNIPLILEFNSSDYWRAKFWKERRYYFPQLLRRIERLNLARADLVVTVSKVCREQILELVPECEGKVLVTPNAVNPEKFHPEVSGKGVRTRLNIRHCEVVVGFAGTFMVYHGIDILARAILDLRRRGQGDGLCFLLMGKGGCQDEIKTFLTNNGCASAVRFTDAIPFNDIQEYLGACDILVSPHNPPPADIEFFGSPIKLFEYMAMGKAIVASRLGQIAEVLRDGQDALLVPQGDEKALAEAILRLANDPDLRVKLGHAARQKVVEQYTWKKNVERVLDALYLKKTPCNRTSGSW